MGFISVYSGLGIRQCLNSCFLQASTAVKHIKAFNQTPETHNEGATTRIRGDTDEGMKGVSYLSFFAAPFT